MGTSNFKIFAKLDDYMNWDLLIAHCETIEGLTEVEREKAKRAFRFLKEELGNDFLKDAFAVGHPVIFSIGNLAPWTRKWITWFADSIKEMKDKENYQSLLKRLKDKERFSEAVQILETAYKFLNAGFSISFDPKMEISGREKIPDLKLTDKDTQEEIFVEVSSLGESKIEQETSETESKIFEPLWRIVPFFYYCGRIHKALSKRHLEKIVREIEKVIEKVQKEKTFQEFVREDVIELGIAPENDNDILEKWASERGLKVGELLGPPYNVDEINRTKQKIEKEQKQLPQGYPNILIIRNNNLFFSVRDIRKAISELEEGIYDYPHLLAVIVEGSYLGSAEDIIIMKDHYVFIKKIWIAPIVNQYMILLNEFCQQKVTPSTITKIYHAFKNY
jgi:hypothetical protein